MAITATTAENREDLTRQELEFFRTLALTGDPGEYGEWEKRANKLSNLLPGEKFYLRYVGKNFDGYPLDRWIVFCEKPPTAIHPGESRIITVMTIETPGKAGEFATPLDYHLEGLRIVLFDWREGRHAAIERLERMKEEEDAVKLKDALTEAESKVDDIFWVWKRVMGENLNFRLGADGTGPNRGGKHFGGAFDRSSDLIVTP
jgi:hypothetical protein